MKLSDRSYNLSFYLRIWATVFGIFGLPSVLFTGLSIYLPMVAVGTRLLTAPRYYQITCLGDVFGNLLVKTRGGPADPGTQVRGNIDKACYALRSGDLTQAEDNLSPCRRAITKAAHPTDKYRKWARTLLDESIEERAHSSSAFETDVDRRPSSGTWLHF